jgi:hypothetical protein
LILAMAQFLYPTAIEQERERLMQERDQLLAMQSMLIARMGMVFPTPRSFMPPPGLVSPAAAKTRSPAACKKQVKFADDVSDDASTCSGSFRSADAAGTTVIMRNIPNRFSHSILASVLDKNGFSGEYDLIYVPIDFATGVSYGYAFVSLTSADGIEEFMACFDGFSDWGGPSKKVCQVVPCDSNESLSERVERYRNLRVMHASVPDSFKPVLYSGGQRVPFPAPTKQIRPPRIQSSGRKE